MKTMKRFGCLLLVLAMVLALGVSAMAAPQTLAHSGDDDDAITGSITINDAVVGETYSIYKLFDLTYSAVFEEGEDDEVDTYSYKVVEAWRSFLESYAVEGVNYFTIDSNGYLNPSSQIFNVNADGMAAFAKAALAYAADEENGITATNEKTAGDTTVLFNELDLGWYLVDSSVGTLCMLTSTDPDAVINEKNGEPTISKYIEDTNYDGEFGSETKSDNNDTLKYALVIENIANVSNLVIHDLLDEQLDLNTVGILAVTLYSSSDDTQGTELTSSQYTYTAMGGDVTCSAADGWGLPEGLSGCSFEISISGSVLEDLDDSAYIVVTYTVELHEDAGDFEDFVDEIDNWAGVSYGNASYAEPAEAETYSFGFEIWKYTDVDESLGYAHHVITIGAYNDSPGGQQDELFLCLVKDGKVAYYGLIEETEDGDNTYTVTQWISAGRVTITEDGPNVTGTYITSEDVEAELPYVTEPSAESGYTADNPLVFTFIYDGILPEHDYIVLDELGTPYNEDNVGEEDAEGSGYTSADLMVGLAGAEFSLSKEVGETTWYAIFELDEESGVYMLQGWTNNAEDEDLIPLVSGEDGIILVEGLHDGTFTLTETKAPDGYNLLGSSIVVVITPDGTVQENGTNVADKEVGVLNEAGLELPGTGGIGTTIFYVIGAILVCGAVVLLVTKRRTSNKNQAEA